MVYTQAQNGNIVENLAHDLKSPIFSQISALNILLKDKSFYFNETQRELLNGILSSNIYMRDLVLNMLSNFKMKNSKIKPEVCEIEKTINFAAKSLNHIFKDNNQILKIKNSCKSPYAEYDEIEIKRVLINLLSNAIKYSNKGSEIILETYNQNGNLVVSVINKGQISCKDPNDVFKPYLTNCKDSTKCSNGLGLYISKQIIEAHFGTLKVENLKDNYVKFSFTIPVINTNL